MITTKLKKTLLRGALAFFIISLFSCGIPKHGILSNSNKVYRNKYPKVPSCGFGNSLFCQVISDLPPQKQNLTTWEDFCKANADQVENVSDQAKKLALSNNDFAVDLYKTLKDKDDKNLFLSPFSISAAFALAYLGADSDTLKNMGQVLHFDQLSESNLHAAFKSLLIASKCQTDAAYEISIANRLWGQKDYPFEDSYIKASLDNYAAPLQSMDFVKEAEDSRKLINAWVEQITNEKIKDLIPPDSISALTKLVLTNAIYFKAPWMDRFETSATKSEDFFVSPSEQVTASFMHRHSDMQYFGNSDIDIVSIPFVGQKDAIEGYATNSRHALVIVLPKAKDGLPALESTLTPQTLVDFTTKLTYRDINLHLPKFKFTSSFWEIARYLQALGMTQAFDKDSADFSKMVDPSYGKLFIDKVIHKAFIDVNETGAEAAAATAIITNSGAVVGDYNPPVPIEFNANHPFLFMITDTKTGSILFMGRVTDPTAE